MEVKREITTEMQELGETLRDALVENWILRGHNTTGNFIEDLTVEWTEEGSLEIRGPGYGLIQNTGIESGNIPYSGRGGGGKSKYITGLINWVELKLGISGQRGKSIAFSIAEKHRVRGMLGSGWLDEVWEMHREDINSAALRAMNSIVQNELDKKK